MENLKVKSFGPIQEVDVTFGDLTLLVGPQAGGKSIFLELLKLLIDKANIRETLERFNFNWNGDLRQILDLYFGEGMSGLWHEQTEIALDGKAYDLKNFLPSHKGKPLTADADTNEHLFYIPSQRILSMPDGRPKNFTDFDLTAPYVLRQFSETTRLLLQNGVREDLFPIDNRLKAPLRDSFDASIFHGGKVLMDTRTPQRRLKMEIGGTDIPFLTWSAGQKEFTPLLMGFYYLCPPSKVALKGTYQYVIIEEPEMGLHPKAIQSVLLQIIDLLSRGYKVVVSTHTPVILEFTWVFRLLQEAKADEKALRELFGLKATPQIISLFSGIFERDIRTYLFSPKAEGVRSIDISSLDAGDENPEVSEWGGLSSFAGRATEIVSKYYQDED